MHLWHHAKSDLPIPGRPGGERQMTTIRIFAVTSLLAASLSACASGGMPAFGAEMGKKSVMGNDVRIPYTSVTSYYGYIKPGAKPDAVVDNKNFYYLYLWIPAIAPEMGVRMMSPVPAEAAVAPEGAFKAPDWDTDGVADAKGDKNYFDTYITFERHATAITAEGVAEAAADITGGTWMKLESNDDTSELPAQPSGSNYNSLLRVTDATKLLRGLYRIGFTTYKKGDVKGTFMAQIGAPIELPGVAIDKDINALLKKIQ